MYIEIYLRDLIKFIIFNEILELTIPLALFYSLLDAIVSIRRLVL